MKKLLVLALVLVPSFAFAEIRVRSGQHVDFTRLTFPLRGAVQGEVAEVENGIVVRVPEETFDLRQVYQRIGRELLRSMAEQEKGSLFIECQCSAVGFQEGRLLVVDLRPSAAPAPTEVLEPPVLSEVPSVPQEHSIFELTPLVLLEANMRMQRMRQLQERVIIPEVIAVQEAPVLPLLERRESDLRAVAVQEVTPISNMGEICRPEGWMDLNLWAGQVDVLAQIADGYAGLYSENDAVTRASVGLLAKRLLAAGLGPEAEAVIQLYPLPEPEFAMLSEAAALVAGEREAPLLLRQQGCGGAWELWAGLAAGGVWSDPKARTAAVTALMTVSLPLQSHLAGILGQSLWAEGQKPEARAMAHLARHEASGRNLAVLIALEEEGPQQAALLLAEVFRAGDEVRLATVQQLTEVLQKSGEALPVALIEQLAIVRSLYQDRPEGLELLRAELQLYLGAGALEAAEIVLAESAHRLTVPERRVLQGAVAEARAEEMGDLAFLDFALTLRPEEFSDAAVNRFAARLLDLGFPEGAQRLLSAPAEGDALVERRQLREQLVAGVRTELLPPPNAQSAPTDDALAWRQGAWGRLLYSENPLLSQAAAAALENPQLPTATKTLADAEQILLRKQDLDQFSAALLAAFPVEAQP